MRRSTKHAARVRLSAGTCSPPELPLQDESDGGSEALGGRRQGASLRAPPLQPPTAPRPPRSPAGGPGAPPPAGGEAAPLPGTQGFTGNNLSSGGALEVGNAAEGV